MNKSDMKLKTEVETALNVDPRINAARIAVIAKNGVLSLEGEVDSYADRWAAEDAARRASGVRVLTDKLKVKVPGRHHHTDEEITEAALHALKWNVWIPRGVRATVRAGRVVLEGTVALDYQSDAAAEAVRHLAGITSVVNEILVVPAASTADAPRAGAAHDVALNGS